MCRDGATSGGSSLQIWGTEKGKRENNEKPLEQDPDCPSDLYIQFCLIVKLNP